MSDIGTRWAVTHAMRNEIEFLRDKALPNLVANAISDWRSTTSAPPWRLPPDGWLADTIAANHPGLRVELFNPRWRVVHSLADEAFDAAKTVDYLARQQAEDLNPTLRPFQPITERRVPSPEHKRTLEAQERNNLPHLGNYAKQLHRHKHQGGGHDLNGLFNDPNIDTTISPAVVVYHQASIERNETSPDQRAILVEHLHLPVGANVRYRHVRSATSKTWWFGTLDALPRWLNKDYAAETGFRLELAPRRGIYLSSLTGDLLNTHLGGEDEVVLPPDTIWRVVGHRDVVQSDDRLNQRATSERLRAIQMIEIEEPDLGVPLIDLTSPR